MPAAVTGTCSAASPAARRTESCSIAEGKASEARHALLRREALELSLYTFKSDSDVNSVTVFLPPRPDGQSATVRVNFTANDAGPRMFRFRIEPQSGEQVTQNNARDALVEVNDRRERVLYLEGEPRFEAKFVRRAVADDRFGARLAL